MRDSPYERYRDALRTGHLAELRGGHEHAVQAYADAARMLPERAAPYLGLGKAHLAAGRPAEALAAYEAAVGRAPGDTGPIDGAARALLELDRGDDAAELLDVLATIYAGQGRREDALTTVERAIEIAGSPWRRAMIEQLRGEQPPAALDLTWLGVPPEPGEDATAAKRPELHRPDRPIGDELRAVAERVEAASSTGDVAGLVAGARALARADRLRAAVDACHDALSVAPADPEVHRTLAAIYRRRGWQRAARTKLRIVERYQRIVDDPDELDREAESALAGGDLDEVLMVAQRHADQGRAAAALDLLFAALAWAPAEPRLHLAIARLHIASGWRERAVEEVNRLARLADVTGDVTTRDAVADFVNAVLRPGVGSTAPAD